MLKNKARVSDIFDHMILYDESHFTINGYTYEQNDRI